MNLKSSQAESSQPEFVEDDPLYSSVGNGGTGTASSAEPLAAAKPSGYSELVSTN